MARFRSRLGNIINSTKNVVDASGVIPAGTSQNIIVPVKGVTANAVTVTELNNVIRGSKVNGFYLSLFFALDINQTGAGVVPLVDWLVFYNKNGIIDSSSHSATNPQVYPVPGATGNNTNRSQVFHESKGLVGEKNDGTKMAFEGVIKLPRSYQRIGEKTEITVIARANFDTVFCAKAIYKWFE